MERTPWTQPNGVISEGKETSGRLLKAGGQIGGGGSQVKVKKGHQ